MEIIDKLSTDAHSVMDPILTWLTLQGLSVIYALVILVVGWRVAKVVRRLVTQMLDRTRRVDPTVHAFLSSLAYYFVLAFVGIAVLQLFGFQTTSLIAVLGATSLAIGLALQGTLTNLAAGVMILMFRPFKQGDYVTVAGQSGTVKEITLFTTELATPDNVQIIVPNGSAWGTTVTNYSVYQTRRLEVSVGISYEDSVDHGLATLMQIATSDPRVHAEPAPFVYVSELGDSAVTLSLRVWCAASDLWALKTDFTLRLKVDVEGAGLSIPYPHTTFVPATSGATPVGVPPKGTSQDDRPASP